MSVVLYEHNQKAYDAALALMAETGKAAVVHPTGTGKSFIGFKLAEQNPGLRICWLSPSEYIYKTQVENLKAAADGYAPQNITFITYAKLMNADEHEIKALQPDYIVLDEFHRCGAVQWSKGVGRLLSSYPDIPVLGLSATNIRYLDNQRDMADELFEGNIASEITLGEAIVRNILLPPVYITSIYSYQKDLEKYQRRAERAKNAAVRDAAQKYLDALKRTLTKADGLDAVFDKHIKNKTGKFIVFCANADHMREMIERSPEWFCKVDQNPRIYSVYAEDVRSDKAFDAFKKDSSEHLKLLFCIDMLNEGVHVENISGVILFRPTVSPIVYKQQIGRALSASKSREPVIFDIVNNFDNLYSIGTIEEEMQEAVSYCHETNNEGQIVNAHFHVFDEAMDCKQLFNQLQDCLSASWDLMWAAASRYYGEYGHLLPPKRYKTAEGFSLGSWIETQRRVKNGSVPGILTGDRIMKLNSIGMVWDRLSDVCFLNNYQYAMAFYEKHGHLDVVVSYITSDGFALGRWLCNLRQIRKGHTSYTRTLTEERINNLDAIGMIWDKVDYSFNKGYDTAYEYYQLHGNLNIPHDYRTSDGMNLGMWICCMRKKYKSGKLMKSQINKLNSIGMIWRNRHEVKWMLNYEKAAAYYEHHGDLDLPLSYKTTDGTALGNWLYTQRQIHRGKARGERLTAEQISKLNAIGMVWLSAGERTFEEYYAAAKAFYDENGHLDVPYSYIGINGKELYYWVKRQRKWCGDGKLSDDEISKFESIGMVS
jgi:superfamily II DNA or RNA helicase